VGVPVTTATLDTAKARGIDLSVHRSQRLSPALIAAHDLVIGMERAHVREAVVLDPTALARTFTLKELARRAGAVGPREAHESLRDWLARVHHGRSTAALLGASPEDDVADPTGGWTTDHETTAHELTALVDQVVQVAWPHPRRRPGR
jgi:protein-tyrosine phosphatase